MTDLNFIAGIAVIVICTIIIGIRIFKNESKPTSIQDFIDMYGDNIISVLKDIISILKIDMDNYVTKEEYEEEVIKIAINAIKENANELGMSQDIVNLFDTDSLTKVIRNIFIENKCDIMSILGKETISNYTNIIDQEVVEVVAIEATENVEPDNIPEPIEAD